MSDRPVSVFLEEFDETNKAQSPYSGPCELDDSVIDGARSKPAQYGPRYGSRYRCGFNHASGRSSGRLEIKESRNRCGGTLSARVARGSPGDFIFGSQWLQSNQSPDRSRTKFSPATGRSASQPARGPSRSGPGSWQPRWTAGEGPGFRCRQRFNDFARG
jgi:hypothetical protein